MKKELNLKRKSLFICKNHARRIFVTGEELVSRKVVQNFFNHFVPAKKVFQKYQQIHTKNDYSFTFFY